MSNALPVPSLGFEPCLNLLRAVAEPTRLRILMLIRHAGELTVSNLVDILGQSQPRISRHLKLLQDAELLRRVKEGSWAFFRLPEAGDPAAVIGQLVGLVDANDAEFVRDRERLAALRQRQASAAQAFFRNHAENWDKLRALHISEERVEAAIKAAVSDMRIRTLLDLGTGTGRMLELFASTIDKGIGLDASHDMLRVARANLQRAGIRKVEVRHGDLFNLALPRDSVDVVLIHQVLHFLDDGGRAIAEAARVLRPRGRVVVVDFAPHRQDFLRETQAHRRLGFRRETIEGWFAAAGLALRHYEAFTPQKAAEGALTIALWVGEDPRLVSDHLSSSVA